MILIFPDSTKVDVPSPEESYDYIYQYIVDNLKNSDYTQLPDVPLSEEKKQEWVTYRQTLRTYLDNSVQVQFELAISFQNRTDFVVNLPLPPQE